MTVSGIEKAERPHATIVSGHEAGADVAASRSAAVRWLAGPMVVK